MNTQKLDEARKALHQVAMLLAEELRQPVPREKTFALCEAARQTLSALGWIDQLSD